MFGFMVITGDARRCSIDFCHNRKKKNLIGTLQSTSTRERNTVVHSIVKKQEFAMTLAANS